MVAFSIVVGLWVILSPLFRSAGPSAQKAIETTIDVSEFEVDEVDIIEWFDKPLVIVRRSERMETRLSSVADQVLADPTSSGSLQPPSATNRLRSVTTGWFVSIGLGTSSGCALKYAIGETENGLPGQFTDGCDGSRFDLAGRALAGGVATKNTPVPYWRYQDGKIIVSTQRVLPAQ